MFHLQKLCRACGNRELVQVMSLGTQPLANDFQTDQGECAGYAPLAVLYCRNCTLAQLSAVVRPEILYKDYPYVTSRSKTMFAHFDNLVGDIERESDAEAKELKWLEIGSNDGTFLAQLACHEDNCLGIEPAKNLSDAANARGIKTIPRLFDTPFAVELGATGYRADVVVARHVFAHIDDWQGFVRALEFVTHKDSLVVIEVPWVVDMLAMNSFDQCYHEHLSFISIGSIRSLLATTLFYLHGVKHYGIHGGAIALMIRRRELLHEDGHPSIFLGSTEFSETGLEGRWYQLGAQKSLMVNALNCEIRMALRNGKKVCGFGASAKATVWANCCGRGLDGVSFICDSTAAKQGKLVPGTSIPVVPEDRLMEADLAVNFSWNFHAEISERFRAFTDKGGHWIIPVPQARVV